MARRLSGVAPSGFEVVAQRWPASPAASTVTAASNTPNGPPGSSSANTPAATTIRDGEIDDIGSAVMTVADRKSRRPRDGVVTRRSHLGDNRAPGIVPPAALSGRRS
jgi:hypothetical protein